MKNFFVKVVEYFFQCLGQFNIIVIYGVFGDYNFIFFDYVEFIGLIWVGNVNEFNVGYVVDGYVCLKGIGVIIIMFGVGELLVINVIVGVYVERVVVVYIVGIFL